jgi:hypothetical protein
MRPGNCALMVSAKSRQDSLQLMRMPGPNEIPGFGSTNCDETVNYRNLVALITPNLVRIAHAGKAELVPRRSEDALPSKTPTMRYHRRAQRGVGTSPDGGRSAAVDPQALFGSLPIRKRSSPPATISACLIHERVSGLPFSSTLCT